MFLERITGNVKESINIFNYKDIYGQETSGKTIKKYDKSGYITEKLEFNAEGQNMTYQKFFYDKKNNLIETQFLDSEGTQIYGHTYFKYDDKNNFIEQSNNDSKETYVYNEKGNLIEEKSQTSYSSSRYVYKYDNKNLLIEEEMYFEEGEPPYKKTFLYDEKNRLVKELEYNQKGKVRLTMEYGYDKSGKMIKKPFISEGVVATNNLVYKNNLLIEENIIKANKQIGKLEYIYNKELVKEIKHSYNIDDGETITYTGSEKIEYVLY